MKVVINACYGGFSLSAYAVKRYAELKGRECYFFVRDIHKDGLRGYGEPATVETANEAFMFSAFDIPNPSEVLSSSDSWHEMTPEEKKASNALYEKHDIENRYIERHDPDLVRVVEELGEKANGRCAKLKIVEIPDDVDYEISEYDGNEHIAEKHRTWG